MTDSGTQIKSVDTAFRILNTLREVDGAGVSELSNRLDIPKSTIYSHLHTLERNELVVNGGSTYRVGLRFLEFGEYTRNRMPIYRIAQPEIRELAEETGELANLAVEEHGWAVCLQVEKGQEAVRLDTFAGKRVPMHCTSMGKAILAHMSQERVRDIIDARGIPHRTENTITSYDDLEAELETIRDQGYAFDRQEYHRGLRCVGTPIRDNDGSVLGAVSISGPTSRMEGERLHETIPEKLTKAVNIIEVNLAYSS